MIKEMKVKKDKARDDPELILFEHVPSFIVYSATQTEHFCLSAAHLAQLDEVAAVERSGQHCVLRHFWHLFFFKMYPSEQAKQRALSLSVEQLMHPDHNKAREQPPAVEHCV